MPALLPSTGLTITNPLVLYRALVATKRIDPDPAQHRLAIHLQKIYHRLLDYEPEIEYSYRIKQLTRTIGKVSSIKDHSNELKETPQDGARTGIFASFRAQKEKADTLALTRKLTDHESARQIQSPQGLLLYGEVGTGKSMLVDLLADCLPNKKKRRWHFNTFMLETFSRLEQLRKFRMTNKALLIDTDSQEHSLLWLAREMISTSPILFLDEFQLPDRAASKILSNLLASFFQLGGVLIATSNRMPEELANASGVEFTAPPASRLGLFGSRWGILGNGSGGRSESMFSQKNDFTAFLDILRSRCEVFQMEGIKDWRRHEAEMSDNIEDEGATTISAQGFEGLEPPAAGNVGSGYEQSVHTKPAEWNLENEGKRSQLSLPKNYLLEPPPSSPSSDSNLSKPAWDTAILRSLRAASDSSGTTAHIPWESTALHVYGRSLLVHRHLSGVTHWTFTELCTTNLGPADYITLASTFHTLILTDVPILTHLHKNEARRLITLLDALYEARCKLLIRAEAGPDELFFPETTTTRPQHDADGSPIARGSDGVYAETFSEIYQDTTSPFRPNISSYTSSASPPTYASSSPHQSTRSILADEDSDFGPVFGAGRSRGASDGAPGAGNEIGSQSPAPGPDFTRTGMYTGEDEKFAYKRARSRLWEMCSEKWWARQEEGWWRPLSKDVRRWESTVEDGKAMQSVPSPSQSPAETGEEQASGEGELFRHGASPFRTAVELPPKIGWTHAWGMMRWGKKAGAWGKGVEGLEERKKGRVRDEVI